MENKEKFSYEQPLLEEAQFGIFAAGESPADKDPGHDGGF